MNLVLCSHEDMEARLAHGAIICTPEEADEYLMHYRVGGEKKGRRLYQYKDGSLTPLGRIHYGVGKSRDKLGEKAEKTQKKADEASLKVAKLKIKSDKANLKARVRPDSDMRKDRANSASSKLAKATLIADQLKYKAEKLARKSKERNEAIELDEKVRAEAAEKAKNFTGNENPASMGKAEYNEWKKKAKEVFKAEADSDNAKMQLANKMDKYDKLDDSEKADVRSQVEKRIAELDKKDGLDHDERKEYDGLSDWLGQKKDSELGKKATEALDKESKKQHSDSELSDMAREEFTGDEARNNELRDVPDDVVKDRIRLIRDWYHDEQYVSQDERVKELKYLTKNVDDLRDLALKNTGDDLLSYVDEMSEKYQKMFNPGGRWDGKAYNKAKDTDEYNDYNELQGWLHDRINAKSGSWNAGEFHKGTNGEKAYSKMNDTYEKLWNHQNKLAEENGMNPPHWYSRNDRKSKAEYDRLQRILKSDSVWSELKAASNKAEKDLCGAVLKDLGFRDTPANRAMIFPFVFFD